MKAAVVEKPGRIKIWEIKEPLIDEYEALVRIRACAICNSTDTKILEGHFPGVHNYPLVLGHEGIGEVVKTGKKVKRFKEGDFVLEPCAKIRDKDLYCGWGAFAEYAIVRDYDALSADNKKVPSYLLRQQVVPRDIKNIAEGTILITLKETSSGLLNFGFKKGMNIMIFGDGPVGCSLVKFARFFDADLIVGIGHWDERLKKMKQLGADHVINEKNENLKETLSKILKHEKFDLVIDAVGRERIINTSLEFIKEGGKIGMYGVSSESNLCLGLSRWPNNVSVHKLFFPVKHENMHDSVLKYVKEGKIRLKDFYSHVISLDEIEKGFQLIKERKAFKVIVKI